jgi:hypothetical protein
LELTLSIPAAKQSDSATEPKDFAEYVSLKSQSESPTEAQSPVGTKPAPASEPAKEEQQEQPKELTDEEKANSRERYERRRERRWYEERGAMRAENQRLIEENAKLREQREQAAPQITGKPLLKQFIDSGKYQTYEDAHEAFTDALTDWKADQREAERQTREAERSVGDTRKAYQADVKEFSKTHDDYEDVYGDVAAQLDSDGGRGNPLTAAILKSKNPASLIYHLGRNPDLLDDLGELASSGDYESALIRLGEIKASMTKGKVSVVKDEPLTPKTPRTVQAKGSEVVNRDDRLRQAADAGDFEAFQKHSRAKA